MKTTLVFVRNILVVAGMFLGALGCQNGSDAAASPTSTAPAPQPTAPAPNYISIDIGEDCVMNRYASQDTCNEDAQSRCQDYIDGGCGINPPAGQYFSLIRGHCEAGDHILGWDVYCDGNYVNDPPAPSCSSAPPGWTYVQTGGTLYNQAQCSTLWSEMSDADENCFADPNNDSPCSLPDNHYGCVGMCQCICPNCDCGAVAREESSSISTHP